MMMATRKIPEAERRRMIAEAAYFKAQRRGFQDGDPIADWVEAEREVEQRLAEPEDLLVRLGERLEITNEQLKALKRKASRVKAEARETFERDVEKIAELRNALEKQLELLRRQGEARGRQARQRAEKLWKDLSELIERVGPHRRAP